MRSTCRDLRHLRLSLGLTLLQASVGVLHRVSLGRIERGETRPRPSTVRMLARRYHVSVGEVLIRWDNARRQRICQANRRAREPRSSAVAAAAATPAAPASPVAPLAMAPESVAGVTATATDPAHSLPLPHLQPQPQAAESPRLMLAADFPHRCEQLADAIGHA